MLRYLITNIYNKISFNNRKPFKQNFISFKQQYLSNPGILTKQSANFQNYISQLILKQKWYQVNELIKLIDLKYFDDWKYIQNIANIIQKVINRQDLYNSNHELDQQNYVKKFKINFNQNTKSKFILDESLKICQFQQKVKENINFSMINLLKILQKMNYQLKDCNEKLIESQKQDKIIKQNIQLQNITVNKSFLKKFLKSFEKSQNLQQKLYYTSFLIKQFPQMINIQQIQNVISSNLRIQYLQFFPIFETILINGNYNNLWSQQFVQKFIHKAIQIRQKRLDFNQNNKQWNLYRTAKFFMFSNFKQHPNQIYKPKKKNISSSTEAKIKQLLINLDYQFQSNLLINGFQIDFLFGNNLLLQYNGFYHYRSNSNQFHPTIRQKWKQNILKKRGFYYCPILFYQWDKIGSTRNIQQQNYLIQKVESAMIENILIMQRQSKNIK